jgi:RNA polymerase sigma-70 factor (ECF subfamily)
MQPFQGDADLVQGLRDRDEAAFLFVVDSWSAGMLRLARSFVSTDESAKEVLQDTWIAVLAGIGSFEGRSSLRTWVCRILVNAAKRRGDRESRVVPWSSWQPDTVERDGPTVDPSRFQGEDGAYPGHWREFPQPWPTPDSAVLAAEFKTTLNRALEQLPARQRMVITLRDVEGYAAEEVCTIMAITAANQRVLLHRARASVRAALDTYFESSGTTARMTVGEES